MNNPGLYSKFHVTTPDGKALGCGSFVLVPFHADGTVRDQAAIDALQFYAERCAFSGLVDGVQTWTANPTQFNWLNNPPGPTKGAEP